MTTAHAPARTAPAAPSSAAPARRTLTIGPHTVDTPVVLAPMAGITNMAFRLLCREFGSRHSHDDGGLYVSEMVTTRALVEGHRESWRLVTMGPRERPRSIQLYGVDPATVRRAVEMVLERDKADHIDLNFGCPVPKVTRRGGGGILPWKTELFTRIVRGAVEAAGDVPVTVKTRIGIDADHVTYRDAGLIAQEVGASAIALHGRTVDQHYSGTANWDAIADLKSLVTDIPVLGNGDIWSAEDALRMVEQTGCDGVVVGRGCQGRPWLFADLAAGFAGLPDRVRPTLGDVARTVRRHAELLVEFFEDEGRGVRDLRKHVAWYFKGYPVGGEMRHRLATMESLEDLDAKLAELDLASPYPGEAVEGPRGRAGTPKRPACPEGWMDTREITPDIAARLHEAELSVSGG
ncbi:tRNA dihydrouridine synthase DusB [Brachybacterium huguangmaarense]|uniref:tRNA dihydrouridine synthase DusB n=1 Tax=Brachybacterium huguangmaarense TaxID=1652028 RepID=A0ABY6FZ31_9MICO|nr:tRNA dihydrouridine synthase DusB [Brachybacterium huguangmaarense]UYG16193.1 tRNA dihydrouridine synthase DusB [Brachybacterium huguangmaarense]